MVQGVDEGVLCLKITGEIPAKRPVLLQRGLVCLQIQPCLFRPEAAQKRMGKEPVLDRHFGGGPPGDALSNPVRLDQEAVYACFFQMVRA